MVVFDFNHPDESPSRREPGEPPMDDERSRPSPLRVRRVVDSYLVPKTGTEVTGHRFLGRSMWELRSFDGGTLTGRREQS